MGGYKTVSSVSNEADSFGFLDYGDLRLLQTLLRVPLLRKSESVNILLEVSILVAVAGLSREIDGKRID